MFSSLIGREGYICSSTHGKDMRLRAARVRICVRHSLQKASRERANARLLVGRSPRRSDSMIASASCFYGYARERACVSSPGSVRRHHGGRIRPRWSAARGQHPGKPRLPPPLSRRG